MPALFNLPKPPTPTIIPIGLTGYAIHIGEQKNAILCKETQCGDTPIAPISPVSLKIFQKNLTTAIEKDQK